MNWTIHEAVVARMINLYKMQYEKPKGKRLLRRPWLKCTGNAKVYVKVMDVEYVNIIRLVGDRDQWRALMNAVLSSRIL